MNTEAAAQLPLVVCWGTKGGVGTSTIAASLALRSSKHSPTLIVDLQRDQWPVLISYPTIGSYDSPATIKPSHVEDPQALIDYSGHRITADLKLLYLHEYTYPVEEDRLADFLVSAASVANVVVDAGTDTMGVAERLEDRGAHRLAVMRRCNLAVAGTKVRREYDEIVVVSEPDRTITVEELTRFYDPVPVREVPYDIAVSRSVDYGMSHAAVPSSLARLRLPTALHRRPERPPPEAPAPAAGADGPDLSI